MPKNFKDVLLSMIDGGILDWETVGQEMLARMSTDEVEDMIRECDWVDEDED